MKKIMVVLRILGIIIFFHRMNQHLPAQVLEQDSLALVALYDSTNGANWTDNSNWLSGPVHTWYGITVDDHRVKRISLERNHLKGGLPTEIGNLTNLRELIMYGNELAGAIPPAIGNLIHLTGLNLTQNDFSGPIPAEIGNLINLEGLALYYNALDGSIPPEIGNLQSLTYLNFHSNQLEGPIPPEIGNLKALTSLSLFRNQLTGPIPDEIWNMTQLTRIRLDRNQLTGSLSAQIGNLTQLNDLRLHGNDLEGPIPPEIGNMVNLTMLSLANNKFNGTIPPEIFDLTNLTSLYLYGNHLEGTLPVELANLPNLTHVGLAGNQFTGPIPVEIGNLTRLEHLSLSDNQLTDTIPSGFGNLKNLEQLYLSGNQFSGSIPEEIGQLPELESLLLNNNQFSDLPDLSADTSLVELEIDHNKFTFEDIEPNIFVPDFRYSPQDSVGTARDTTIDLGTGLTFSVTVGGTANEYQWQKDEVDIPGANGSSYTIDSATSADQGSYLCKITNTIAPNLTLYSRPFCVSLTGEVGIVKSSDHIPNVFNLQQNYPNPFNPQTTIAYQLPKASQVKISLYNATGQLIETMVNAWQPAGQHSVKWTATQSGTSSGIYFYQIQAGDYFEVKKCLLLK